MKWLVTFFTSSLGQKLIMSLTGLFLCLFLIVHMSGNFQLFVHDEGESFNLYAKFMTTNPFIKTVSWGLYAMILLHAIKGLIIAYYNRKARGNTRYVARTSANASWASRRMAILGTGLLVFIVVHMAMFWYRYKWGVVPLAEGLEAEGIKDLYLVVSHAFKEWYFVVFYVLAMILLAFHLWHGFQSAFQTLGLNHRKYTPLIKGLGMLYSILIPLGFATMPLYFFLGLDGA